MLYSLALILLVGLVLSVICQKLNIPSLIGLILGGILLGPFGFNLLDTSLLEISADLRQIILIIILTQAGLSLNLSDLKKVGRPAVLLSFVPATFEMLAVAVLAPIFLKITFVESALLGSVLAAVSPAVVVPRMVKLMNEKYGTEKGIPQLILAGSSVDDIYALVVFSSFLSLAQSGEFSAFSLLEIPISIISGIIVGSLGGYLLSKFFKQIKFTPLIQVLILLSISFVFVSLEDFLVYVPFSGILAVMSMAILLYREIPIQANKIRHIYDQLWLPGEIFLFMLVGASVNIQFAFSAGFLPIVVILFALLIRMLGTWISLWGTRLSLKEKIFTLIAYTPKATVQAAIGGVPLAFGLPVGELILTMSVLAILITAPLGAFGIDLTYRKLFDYEGTFEVE